MDTYDLAWAPLLQCSGGVDERELASYRDLAMARSPLRTPAGGSAHAGRVGEKPRLVFDAGGNQTADGTRFAAIADEDS